MKKASGSFVIEILLAIELIYLSYFGDLFSRSTLFLLSHGMVLVLLSFLLMKKVPGVEISPSKPGKLFTPTMLLVLGLLASLRFLVPYFGHPWPTGDEALQAFLGIHLSEQWTWHFFYTVGEHPPLSVWTYALWAPFFSSVHWLYTFVNGSISILIVLSWWLAARVWSSQGTDRIFLFLLAFSFWPVFYSEFYIQGATIPLLEGLILWAAGMEARSSDQVTKRWAVALWGLFTGLGFFTYASWIAVGTASGVLFLIAFIRDKKKDPVAFVLFGTCLLLAMGPFLWAWVHEGMGAHMRDITMTNARFPLDQKIKNALSYWTALFFGPLNPNGSYGPAWGGFLNPFLGVAFFSGAAAFLRSRPRFSGLVLAALMVWLMVPGMVTSDYPCLYRIVQVMPLVLIFCAVGIQAFLAKVGPKRRWILVSFLALSCLLDSVHLVKASGANMAFQRLPTTPEQTVNQEAFRILKGKADHEGVGLIFSDFLLLSRNHSLSVETYPFNAALNPRLDPAQSRWAALLVNKHLEGPLSKRFPTIQWLDLPSGQMEEDGGLILGTLSLDADLRARLEPWVKAHRFFHERQFEAESILNDPVLYQKACRDLSLGYRLMKGDPFLESVYGEWVAQYHFRIGLGPNIQALLRAVAKGYPTANLYLKYGNFLYLNGQKDEALRAYSMAAQCRPNYTDAQGVLDYLRRSPQRGGAPNQ